MLFVLLRSLLAVFRSRNKLRAIHRLYRQVWRPIHYLFLYGSLGLFAATVFVSLYASGYTFLYGFYFGDLDHRPSMLEVLVHPVPFYDKPVIFVGVFLLLCLVFIMLLIRIFTLDVRKASKVFYSFIMIVFLFVFHLGLTLFFVSGSAPLGERMLHFSLVWFGPVAIAIQILWMLRMPKAPFSGFAGVCFALLVVVSLSRVPKDYHDVIITLYPFVIMLVSYLVSWLEPLIIASKKHWFWVRLIYLSSFVGMIGVAALWFCTRMGIDKELVKNGIYAGAATVSLVWLVFSYRFPKLLFIPLYRFSGPDVRFEEIWKPITRFHKTVIVSFVLICIVSLVTLVPLALYTSGVYIRSAIEAFESSELQDIIEFGEAKCIKGFVVGERNGMVYVYVAGQHAKIIKLKADSITVNVSDACKSGS